MRPHVGWLVQRSSGKRVAQTDLAAAVEGPWVLRQFRCRPAPHPAQHDPESRVENDAAEFAIVISAVALATAMLALLLVLR
jgi:hypothetical protein